MVLYVLTRVANISFEQCVRACAPFIVPLVLVLGLITFVPFVTLWLPTLIFR
jgi:TRAP-type C4-dicarboxylate transport system permease large subunit